jgi:aspartyl aminopeptidase
MKQDIHALMDFLTRSVSPYHGVAEVLRILKEEGFEELPLTGDWQLVPGGKYRIDCRGTMAVAFTVGKTFAPQDGFRVAANHMDWPCFYIKPDPEQVAAGCLKLSVEPYGGLIHSTWMDRPLSCAGLVTLKGERAMEPERRLFDFGRPLFTIPNLAIHMNREVNKGVALDPAKDLLPLADYFGNTDGHDPAKMAVAPAIEEGRVLPVPVLADAHLAFELEVKQFIPLDDGEVMLCKIRNVLQDDFLAQGPGTAAEKLAAIAPVHTTCKHYFGWDGRDMGAWGEPMTALGK